MAGPALGLTLFQFHRSVLSLYKQIRPRNPEDKEKINKFLQDWAKTSVNLTSAEKIRLDEVEAYYDFCVSTGLVLVALTVFAFFPLDFLGLNHIFFSRVDWYY